MKYKINPTHAVFYFGVASMLFFVVFFILFVLYFYYCYDLNNPINPWVVFWLYILNVLFNTMLFYFVFKFKKEHIANVKRYLLNQYNMFDIGRNISRIMMYLNIVFMLLLLNVVIRGFRGMGFYRHHYY